MGHLPHFQEILFDYFRLFYTIEFKWDAISENIINHCFLIETFFNSSFKKSKMRFLKNGESAPSLFLGFTDASGLWPHCTFIFQKWSQNTWGSGETQITPVSVAISERIPSPNKGWIFLWIWLTHLTQIHTHLSPYLCLHSSNKSRGFVVWFLQITTPKII